VYNEFFLTCNFVYGVHWTLNHEKKLLKTKAAMFCRTQNILYPLQLIAKT